MGLVGHSVQQGRWKGNTSGKQWPAAKEDGWLMPSDSSKRIKESILRLAIYTRDTMIAANSELLMLEPPTAIRNSRVLIIQVDVLILYTVVNSRYE